MNAVVHAGDRLTGECYQTLLSAATYTLKAEGEVTFDLSQVTQADLVGLSVIVRLARHYGPNVVHIAGATPPVIELIERGRIQGLRQMLRSICTVPNIAVLKMHEVRDHFAA